MLRLHTLASVLAMAVAAIGAPVRQVLVQGNLIVDGNLKATGRISTDEFVQINGIAVSGTGCSPNGVIARDDDGQILSCYSGVWRKPGVNTVIRESSNREYMWPTAFVACEPHERVVGGGGGCEQPSGYIWLMWSKPENNGWYVKCDGGMNRGVDK
ncbi:hypothetical protein EDD21DRAFT_127561 [Dissophora ornata]|nr:hypothetical protein EDD21DRAFT_127561 [Dissophora ornata]